MNLATQWPNEGVLIPDLLQAAPHIRPVLDRYGLRGCGGPLGPVETLGYFARAHEVPLGELLREVRNGLRAPAPSAGPEAPTAEPGDAIYRPFFKAGIVVVLTLGATWGAYLLVRIALGRSFRAADIQEINAHGQAQIFGWVGLFVMGFAYQAFPRFKHTALARPRWAYASLGILALGLVARSICQPLADSVPGMTETAVAGSLLEVMAVWLFAWIVLETVALSGKPLALYDYYAFSALAWFVIQAHYETIYLAATLAAQTPGQLIDLVATWQAPLREIQIYGFALLMILGVSQRIFPYFYGLPNPGRRRGAIALVCLNVAVIGQVAGLLLARWISPAWAGLWYGSVLLLAGSVLLLLYDWRIFSRARDGDRSLKFLRAAYVWLLASLAMLVLMPAYLYAVDLRFSHAYYGAVRHAVTVGFISLMIVGVAAKVVPTLNGVNVRALRGLWGPFLLINAGCALRVVSQALTDVTPMWFPIAGVSGLLEVLGLALWGVHLWSVMAGKYGPFPGEDDQPLPGYAISAAGAPFGPEARVGDVLRRRPDLLEIFLSFGFRPLANPLIRRSMAPYVTIERACALLNVDMARLLDTLNDVPDKRAEGRLPLPVLSSS
jgi:hypothetical protein